MANTPNFNWNTPNDTDLVKDGASAIRSLGNSIDTAFVELKGGTTGQILSKASNPDLDYTWINNDQGDITEVVAGTGLTGGGSSGSATPISAPRNTPTLTSVTRRQPRLPPRWRRPIFVKGTPWWPWADTSWRPRR